MRSPKLSRRRFLKTTLATGAALAGAGTFANQSWYSKRPALLAEPRGNRVVIIGGGWGGMAAARALLREAQDIEVVMLEPKPFFMSCPMSNLYLAGVKDLDFLVFDYGNAIEAGLTFINEAALEIDRDAKRVATSSGSVTYDYLILSPGIDYMYGTIQGFGEVAQLMPVGFRPFEHLALKRQIEAFTGGDFVISIPKGPYRCPPGPYERVAMLAYYLKKNKVPAKITVLDANNLPLAKPEGFMAAFDELYADYIDYIPNAEVVALDYARQTVTTASLGDFRYDAANLIPQMQAGEIVRASGLGERWAEVRQPYFVSKDDDDVYLLGDIIGNMPVPKSGMIANSEGHIIARHLARRVAGSPLDEITPEGPSNICYSFVNAEESIWVSAAYGLDEIEAAIVRMSNAVDETRSVTNGEQALAWARGLWTDMFGEA